MGRYLIIIIINYIPFARLRTALQNGSCFDCIFFACPKLTGRLWSGITFQRGNNTMETCQQWTSEHKINNSYSVLQHFPVPLCSATSKCHIFVTFIPVSLQIASVDHSCYELLHV